MHTECGLDSSSSRQGQVAGWCESCNEISGSIKGGEFTDQLRDYQLVKYNSTP
jgi:hypothetical protein